MPSTLLHIHPEDQPVSRETIREGSVVRYVSNGVVVEGTVCSDLVPFYPDSTLTKYGNGSIGRRVFGYQVRGPIVSKDGAIYMVRGRMAPGISHIAAADLTIAD